MGDDKKHRGRRGRHRSGYRSGGGGLFFLVLTLGMLLTRLKVNIGLGVSARLPMTSSHFTLAWSLGPKGSAVAALPPYAADKVGGTGDYINSSHTMTVGPAEGIVLAVVGEQPGAPVAGFHWAIVRSSPAAG